ncbi:hypothetical protein LSTR_LSTR014933 [Laodelphax striatellus]|uniref:G-protein coupled receptors family 1 profile domain-containing protein n=1 Tax=Laodelphax striatellus TaxID=195883 RepID=A0A482WQ94_LAOST|nr:hypothetical protein LSTR_LSTR014933 [Laodelphax striatellus]
MLVLAEYGFAEYVDGSIVPVCLTQADKLWKASYFVLTISLFFGLPLVILIVLYSVIARQLMTRPGLVVTMPTSSALRYRRQVVMMLATVVLSFFACLLPFRAFTLWIILASPEWINSLGVETYYNILYFSRIMLYINSAMNPILYNLMSSKFREGFKRLLGIKCRGDILDRKGTLTTTTTTTTNSCHRKASQESHQLLKRNTIRKNISY